MKVVPSLCFLCFLWPSALVAQSLKVVIPTAEQEAEYVWRTIWNIPFFDEHGYQISLPSGELIDRLKQKARQSELNDSDYAELLSFMESTAYDRGSYGPGYRAVKERIPLLEQMLRHIAEQQYAWGFRIFDPYEIVLTLYGPGGSYDPDEGSILVYTTREGKFKRYSDPANTLIHELVHIGLEQSIIRRFDVPHETRERIVDTFVSLHFRDELPDYQIQPMGDTALDDVLDDLDDLKELDVVVGRFLGG